MLNGLPRNWLGEPGIQASAKLSALLARRNILLHNVVGNMRQFIGTPPCSIEGKRGNRFGDHRLILD